MTRQKAGIPAAKLAQKIVAEASHAGAKRVAFTVSGNFVFTEPDHSSIEALLLKQSPVKYKLQKRIHGHWKDIQASRPINFRSETAGPTNITNLIRDASFDSLQAVGVPAVINARGAQPQRFVHAVRSLHRKVFMDLAREKTSDVILPALDFFSEFNQLGPAPETQYIEALLRLYKHVTPRDLASIFDSDMLGDLSERISIEIRENANYYNSDPARAAVSNTLGKIWSLRDRSHSANQFRDMRKFDTFGLLETFYLESGVNTYFASAEIQAEAKSRASLIRQSITPLKTSDTGNKMAVAIAMDPHFYRIYGAQIIFYAQQLSNVDFNILICASSSEAQKLISDAQNFSSSLSELNQGREPSNIHHYYLPVPDYVVEKETFYASARFFMPQLLLAKYPSLYLMDADLSTDSDPRPYLIEVANLAFATPKSSGFDGLHPWRRYMAGNVAINRDVLDTNMLADLQEYLAHGLPMANNWTLDQNALAYAIERYSELYSNLNGFHRPFYQSRFRVNWEKNYQQARAESIQPLT